MKTFLILFIKGFLIGIGKIIPGVSGSMIAITFNLYEKMIYAINHIFKKENIYFLFPIGLGAVFAILFSSKGITYLLNNYYLATMLLFTGLIMGGIPNLLNKTNVKKSKNIFLFILSFSFVIILSNITNFQNRVTFTFLTHLFMGIVESVTMIVPGISGTALFILFGYYDFFLNVLSNCMTNFLSYFSILLPFCIGMIIGVVVTSKIMSFFFSKYKEEIYALIIGFSLSSVVLLLKQTLQYNYSKIEISISLFLMLLGYFIQKKLEKNE